MNEKKKDSLSVLDSNEFFGETTMVSPSIDVSSSPRPNVERFSPCSTKKDLLEGNNIMTRIPEELSRVSLQFDSKGSQQSMIFTNNRCLSDKENLENLQNLLYLHCDLNRPHLSCELPSEHREKCLKRRNSSLSSNLHANKRFLFNSQSDGNKKNETFPSTNYSNVFYPNNCDSKEVASETTFSLDAPNNSVNYSYFSPNLLGNDSKTRQSFPPHSSSSSHNSLHEPVIYDFSSENPSIHPSNHLSSQKNAVLKLAQLISSFEKLPESVRQYLLFHLLSRCGKHAVQNIHKILLPIFQKNFLTGFPAEITNLVLTHLDAPSLCAVSQVSHHWYKLVSSNEELWKSLFLKDGFFWDSIDSKIRTMCLEQSLSACAIMKRVYFRHFNLRERWLHAPEKIKRCSFPIHGVRLITKLQFDDDKIIVSTCSPRINIYDTKTGVLIRSLEEHEGDVWTFEYVGDTLVTGSTDRTVRVWDLRTGECKQVFYGHTSTIRCIKIVQGNQSTTDTDDVEKENRPASNDANSMPPYIISSSRDCTIRLWSLPCLDDPPFVNVNENPDQNNDFTSATTNPFYIRTLRGHTDSVREVACLGDLIVSASYDGTLRVWKASTGVCLHVLRGHVGRVYSVTINPSRQQCISAGTDAKIRIWNLESGELLQTLHGHSNLVSQVTFNQNILVSASAPPDTSLRVWDLNTGSCRDILKCPLGHIFFQHDESKVVSGSHSTLQLWDIRSGKLVRDLLTDLDIIWQVAYNENVCVAAVLRNNRFWIEVLEFGSTKSS
ncbi:cullin 1 adaptor protein Pop1 [Schizosaccharomyces pombe]|uniref:WD repeat-containing protein pop1 n=1 Tax=Schizosaccharomyces pombe (strain 972 / ATCC 24843) TaxID=284812 RepID=POP1_SCHPO|nr:cullin 1 adaptor protein Pop1 [Schizosaccharomyces pombe]P87060.1 RecName: Full=WD repeat-containing protein pop1; AltName: Full=WD repeat-containing protein ste16 [Schizosaccharomyces pombe 972h-]CAA69671.1 WD repeat protein Pop1 [Schizosaccharomyces pombe]CAB75991.2 cullin 1 adaptor protein Pop1 [Schizosaccharomyces pombe]|eukprot:NP_001342944.1 cullin 1 adaptor protein Pop1 [Schizosaccharomyces pombe]